MGSLLIKNASLVATMDDASLEIPNAGIYAVDGFIEQVGPSADLPHSADEVIDLKGHVVLPGLVNTHHHFYQTLTRAVPGTQDAGLFDWLTTLYPIWAKMRSEHIEVSTKVALTELALSGCTTAFDHLYLFPNDCTLDDEIEAAADIGLRLHASRGSMSLGESAGGLPPDEVVETPEEILKDTQRLIGAYHDPRPGSMTQVVVAPCSPFSVTADLMRESATLARAEGVRLHTHLAETLDEEAFCLSQYQKRPVELAESLDWLGSDVWFAHGVFVDEAEAHLLGETGTGIAHCPSSNMRLASGLAPIRRYLNASVPIGVGVDGSASNDGSHLLAEVRQAMLLARLDAAPNQSGGDLMSVRTALRLATRGGARLLGRSDIGSLEAGKAADMIAIDMRKLEYAGAQHDLLAAVLLAAPTHVDHSWVGGKRIVDSGRVRGFDQELLIERHNKLSGELVS